MLVLQAKLNCISSKTFPIPQGSSSDSTSAVSPNDEGAAPQPALTVNGTAVGGANLLKFHLRPASRVNQVETVAELTFNASDIQKQLEQGGASAASTTLSTVQCQHT